MSASSWLRPLVALLGMAVFCLSAGPSAAASAPPFFQVDPKGTWLSVDTAAGDRRATPTKISLTTVKLKAGEFVALRRKGSYINANGATATVLLARFYGAGGYLQPGADEPPAAVTTPSTCAPGGTPKATNVSGDFFVGGTTWTLAQIPVGATGIAFGPNSCYVKENTDMDANFGVEIVPAYQKIAMSAASAGAAVNVTILADGFTYQQRAQFGVAASAFRTALLAVEPYKSNAAKIKFTRIMSPSQQSGARANAADTRDTFYKSFFFCDGVTDRLLCSDTTAVNKAIRRNLGASEREIVLVLVNTTTYGGSGGAFAVSSLAPQSDRIAIHELGHSFGHLDDEYDYGGGCDFRTPWGFNVTITLVRANIPWKNFIAGTTPLPTTGTDETIGAYEGAFYCTTGWYRPTYRSIMRDLGDPFLFKAVNEDQLRRQILAAAPASVVSVASRATRHLVLSLSSPVRSPAIPLADAQSADWSVAVALDMGLSTDVPAAYDGPDALVVVAIDASGIEIARLSVPDPRLRRLEAGDGNGGILSRGLAYAPTGELELWVPQATRSIRILDAKASPGRASAVEVGRVDVAP